MDEVRVEDSNYQMPPQEGFTIAHFLTVADLSDPPKSTKRSLGEKL